MGMMLSAYVWRDPDGETRAEFTVESGAASLGVMRAHSKWTVVDALGDPGDDDAYVSVASTISALGSRLLRLSAEIASQRPLFNVHSLGGGAE